MAFWMIWKASTGSVLATDVFIICKLANSQQASWTLKITNPPKKKHFKLAASHVLVFNTAEKLRMTGKVNENVEFSKSGQVSVTNFRDALSVD